MTTNDIQTEGLRSLLTAGQCRLDHLGVMRATGVDAATFLNNMLTQDVLLLQPKHARLAAQCSVKGRMVATGWVIKLAPDDLLWVISADILEATLKRLKMFVMRSKLVLAAASTEFLICGELANNTPESPVVGTVEITDGHVSTSLPAVCGLSRMLHLIPVGAGSQNAQAQELGADSWLIAEVLAGVGRVTAKTVDAYVPQMLNYESTHGVNFKKGCYPGQEVVARSQFRGTLKRRAFVLNVAQPNRPVAAGDEVFLSSDLSTAIGTICNAAQCTDGNWVAIASMQIAAGLENIEINAGRAQALPLPYVLLDDI